MRPVVRTLRHVCKRWRLTQHRTLRQRPRSLSTAAASSAPDEEFDRPKRLSMMKGAEFLHAIRTADAPIREALQPASPPMANADQLASDPRIEPDLSENFDSNADNADPIKPLEAAAEAAAYEEWAVADQKASAGAHADSDGKGADISIGSAEKTEMKEPEGGWDGPAVDAAVLSALEADRIQDALQLLITWLQSEDAKQTEGPSLDESTFVMVMRALTGLERSDLCEDIMELMKQDGRTPTIHAYNALLNAMGAKSIQNMFEVAHEMVQSGVDLDIESYSIMFIHCLIFEAYSTASELLSGMKKKGVTLDVPHMAKIAAQLNELQHFEGTIAMQQMVSDIGVPDSDLESPELVAELMTSFACLRMFPELSWGFDVLMASGRMDLVPTVAIESHLSAEVQAGRVGTIVDILTDCTRAGAPPLSSMQMCANVLYENKDNMGLTKLLIALLDHDVDPGPAIVNQAFSTQSFTRDVNSAFKSLQISIAHGYRVSPWPALALLRALAKRNMKPQMIILLDYLAKLEPALSLTALSNVMRSLWEYSNTHWVQMARVQRENGPAQQIFASTKKDKSSVDEAMGGCGSVDTTNIPTNISSSDEASAIGLLVRRVALKSPEIIPRLDRNTVVQSLIVCWRWRLVAEFETLFTSYDQWTREALTKLVLELCQGKAFSPDAENTASREKAAIKAWARVLQLLIKRKLLIGPFAFMSLASCVVRAIPQRDEDIVSLLVELTASQIQLDIESGGTARGNLYLKYALEEPAIRASLLGIQPVQAPFWAHGTDSKVLPKSSSSAPAVYTLPQCLQQGLSASDYDSVLKQRAGDGCVEDAVLAFNAMKERGLLFSNAHFDALVQCIAATSLPLSREIVTSAIKVISVVEDVARRNALMLRLLQRLARTIADSESRPHFDAISTIAQTLGNIPPGTQPVRPPPELKSPSSLSFRLFLQPQAKRDIRSINEKTSDAEGPYNDFLHLHKALATRATRATDRKTPEIIDSAMNELARSVAALKCVPVEQFYDDFVVALRQARRPPALKTLTQTAIAHANERQDDNTDGVGVGTTAAILVKAITHSTQQKTRDERDMLQLMKRTAEALNEGDAAALVRTELCAKGQCGEAFAAFLKRLVVLKDADGVVFWLGLCAKYAPSGTPIPMTKSAIGEVLRMAKAGKSALDAEAELKKMGLKIDPSGVRV